MSQIVILPSSFGLVIFFNKYIIVYLERGVLQLNQIFLTKMPLFNVFWSVYNSGILYFPIILGINLDFLKRCVPSVLSHITS